MTNQKTTECNNVALKEMFSRLDSFVDSLESILWMQGEKAILFMFCTSSTYFWIFT